MADAINSSIDILRTYMDDGAVLYCEGEVPLQHITGEEDAVGTCDVAIISNKGTMLTIADLKYGQGVMVYASDRFEDAAGTKFQRPNGQLAMYASGWLQANGFMYEDVQQIRLVVLQPRMEWHDEYLIPLNELRLFEDSVRDAAGRVELNRQVAAEGNELDLVPGEKQCKFCKAKGICPALRNSTASALTVMPPSEVERLREPLAT
jgi:hypothetical protein